MWPFTRKKWETLGRSMSAEELRGLLMAGTPFLFSAPLYCHLKDTDLRALPAAEFELLVFDCWFPHDEPAYKSEIWDCDDFAVAFMAAVRTRWAKVSRGKEALAFGYVSGLVEGMGNHAFIWAVDDKGVVNFYEPQTGKRVNYVLKSVVLVET